MTVPFETVRKHLLSNGMDAVASIPVPAGPLSSEGLDTMLADGVGDMQFMKAHRLLRLDPSRFLPNARSIICATMNYAGELEETEGESIRRARYARGKDYHRIFRKALAQAARELADAEDLEHEYRPAVDSAPLLERTLAQRAGLGWIGKNGLLLIPGKGSYHFLGFLFTTLDVEVHNPSRNADRCGSCSRCLEACPTAAIVPGRRVLSERCISYLTIEHQGVIPKEMAEQFNGWWFGCDICQEVCPWNRFTPEPGESRFLGEDREDRLLQLRSEEYDSYFAGRAIRRISYSQFRRNLMVALYSLGRRQEAKSVAKETPDELVQEQAVELGLFMESNKQGP